MGGGARRVRGAQQGEAGGEGQGRHRGVEVACAQEEFVSAGVVVLLVYGQFVQTDQCTRIHQLPQPHKTIPLAHLHNPLPIHPQHKMHSPQKQPIKIHIHIPCNKYLLHQHIRKNNSKWRIHRKHYSKITRGRRYYLVSHRYGQGIDLQGVAIGGEVFMSTFVGDGGGETVDLDGVEL